MIWLDTETRSTVDVTECGVYRMARDPTLQFISIHYAFDDGPVAHWRGIFGEPGMNIVPPFELWDRIRAGEEIGIWNAAFERHVWNAIARRTATMPDLKVEQLRCIATLARAHNLPAALKNASQWLPIHLRKLAATNFTRLWSTKYELTPDLAPLYDSMLIYGDADVTSMREIARLMTGFSAELLQDYAVSEAINDRGVGIDRPWCERAVALRTLVEGEIEKRMRELTEEECPACGGKGRVPGVREGTTKLCEGDCKGTGRIAITSAKQPAKLRAWIIRELELAGVATEPVQFERAKKKIRADRTGYFSEIRASFDKTVRRKLQEWLDERGVSVPLVTEMLSLIEDGAGAAASKYQSALNRCTDDGIMRGMYILDGAAQTGRFASVGMQTHNMVRDVLDRPSEVIETITGIEDRDVAPWCATEFGLRVTDTLGRLLRPTLVPRKAGNVLLWGDWSAVEARVCPWLSGRPSAEPLLDLFRQGKDVYLAAASAIAGYKVTDRKDPNRQLGKVATLSLGFGGASGAFVSMARNYGIEGLPADEVKGIVNAWRAANPWAREWWDELEQAARMAIRYPGQEFPAGRVTFAFLPGLLEGALVMWLPDGRPLFYPATEIRMGSRFEDEAPREVITFVHAAFGRIPLWYGQLAENATQGTAASLLRRTLGNLEADDSFGETVGHTHDEIIVECDARHAREAARHLHERMVEMPDWAPGLPLAAEVGAGWAYYDPAPELLAARREARAVRRR